MPREHALGGSRVRGVAGLMKALVASCWLAPVNQNQAQ